MESSPQTHDGPNAAPAEPSTHVGRPGACSLRFDALVSGILLAVVLAVFAGVLGNDFVQWDDDIMVYQNPHIQGLDLDRLRWMFTDVAYAMRYKPLTWLCYAVIYSLRGLDAFAFHLVALLFHAANTVLVYWLLRRLARPHASCASVPAPAWRAPLVAGLGALIWAVHPLRVEPVARATDLTYGQSLFFCLVSLLCYLRAADLARDGRPRMRWQVAAVIGYALAMLSYPFAVGYGVILLILDVWPLRRLRLTRNGLVDRGARWVWIEKIPYLLLAGLAFMTWFGRVHPTGMWTLQESRQLGLFARAMQACYVWIYYLARPWWPVDLAPVYTTLVDFSPTRWPFLSSAVLVVLITALCVWARRRWPLLLLVWLCHLILLVPALGLTESPHYTCDRYAHLPAVVLSVLVLFGLCRLGGRAFAVAAATMALVVVLLSSLTVRQVRVWRDSESLFQHTIATLGQDPYRAIIHRRLGMVHAGAGRLDQAIEEFRTSLAIRPGALARRMLADALERQGQWEAALVQVREDLQRNPDEARSHGKAGSLLARLGRMREAVVELGAALRLRPDSVSDLNLLAWILATDRDASVRNPSTAVSLAERAGALAGQPRADLSLTLATAYLAAGRLDQAMREAERAALLAKTVNDESLRAKCQELRGLVARARAAMGTGDGAGSP